TGTPQKGQMQRACVLPNVSVMTLCSAPCLGISLLPDSPSLPSGLEKEGNHDMEELRGEKEGKLEKEGKPEDEVESEDEEKSDGEKKPDKKAKPARQGKLEEEGGPGEPGQPQDEGKSGNQGKSEGEGKRQGEGKHESQAKPASEARAAEKRPAEDYVPRKAKRKTDRMTDDSPKNSQEDLQDRHVSSEEMMRECADVTRAQEELRKRQKMGGFHWMPSPQDALVPRGQRGVRGAREAYMTSHTFKAFGLRY
ncbi:transcription elongation factor A protein-like 3, partial [Sigmodon hispidus]